MVLLTAGVCVAGVFLVARSLDCKAAEVYSKEISGRASGLTEHFHYSPRYWLLVASTELNLRPLIFVFN
jgi:hypothetical protein